MTTASANAAANTAPSSMTWPGRQPKHCVAESPSASMAPSGHGSQAVAPTGEYAPFGQLTQGVDASWSWSTMPAGHGLHLTAAGAE
jgi:hypothetical protein